MTCRRSAAGGLLGLALVLVLVSAGAPAQAQETVRLSGTVQWIAATTMQLMTISGASVAVDLTDTDQASYHGLHNGDAVVVLAVVAVDRRRVIAREIRREQGGSQAP